MLLTMWIISMGLVLVFLDALLTGNRTLGWFVLAGGVGASVSTVALAEEVLDILRRRPKAPGASAEERTGLKSLSELFAALRPSRPALPPPVGKRRRFGRNRRGAAGTGATAKR